MPMVARTVGGPGAGKTSRAMEILDLCLKKEVQDPFRIGFISFTKAARRVASSRAAERFNLKAEDLEKHGWFRTIHSIAFRQIGVDQGELLVGGKEDNEWLQKALGDDTVRFAGPQEREDSFTAPASGSEAGQALALWDAARNFLVPVAGLWRGRQQASDRMPPLGYCHSLISRYEAAKRKDGRLDFCDLLMRFAGRQWSGVHDAPFRAVEPDGEVPLLPVWLHDEAQDMSALTALVFRRLIAPSHYAYLFGDFLQSIYSFCGSDGTIFADWPVAKEEELPVSYRCGQKILDYSWRIVAPMKRAASRQGFKAAREGGEIHRALLEQALSTVKPGDDTLILARTNEYASSIGRFLDDYSIPWKPTKGGGVWTAPARASGVSALWSLRNGLAIDGEGFWRLMELLPVKAEGKELFQRGTKTHYKEEANRESLMPMTLAESDCAGATEWFKQLVSSGNYLNLLQAAPRKMAHAAETWGIAAIADPTIRVGTAHSAKGDEADRVIALNKLPYPAQQAIQTQAGLDEERRLWYVTASRARHHLTIAESDGEPFGEL